MNLKKRIIAGLAWFVVCAQQKKNEVMDLLSVTRFLKIN